MAFIDIDRIPELMRVSRLLGHNRFNWASFDDRDHFGDPAIPLRKRLEDDALRAGVDLPSGPIFLLTHLRYLGYNFNPVSFFYCYGEDGTLETILTEVNNTFGETENYWLSSKNQLPSRGTRRFASEKRMHVSPFMPMGLRYTFVLSEPGEDLTVHMNTIENDEVSFGATLRLVREPWSSSSVRRALIRHPWMTAKVVAAIHWEALKLWIKKLPVFPHPTGMKWKV